MCQINQVLDKSGRIVYSLVMGVHNRVSDKPVPDKPVLDKPVLDKQGVAVFVS